ncbi:MAG: hypothetical protein ACJA1W_001813 [Akkermansiaceae bacterium]|jgi:hypothetical protein
MREAHDESLNRGEFFGGFVAGMLKSGSGEGLPWGEGFAVQGD